jgi:hypothetical protein
MSDEKILTNPDAKKVEIKVVDDQWLRIGESSQPVRDAWTVRIEKESSESWAIVLGFAGIIGLPGYAVFCVWWIPDKYEGLTFGIWWLFWAVMGAILALKHYAADQENPKFTVSARCKRQESVILEHGTRQEAENVRAEFETLVGKYMKVDEHR